MRSKNFCTRAISLLLIICAILTYNMMYYKKALSMSEAAIEEANAANSAPANGKYIDGQYEGTGKGYGGQITCRITISSGSISSIAVVSAPNEDAAYYNKAVAVLDEIAAEQSAEDIDTISGATYSSNGLIDACKDALAKAGEK